MDKTLRKVLGYKLKAENSVVEILLETVEGVTVAVDIVPEAIGDLVLTLMTAKTVAALKQDEGLDEDVAAQERMVIHHLFPADRLYVVKQPNPDVCHVSLHSGQALFEFLVPAKEVFQKKPVQQE